MRQQTSAMASQKLCFGLGSQDDADVGKILRKFPMSWIAFDPTSHSMPLDNFRMFATQAYYGPGRRRPGSRIGTNLLVLFESVSWFFEFSKTDWFWSRLRSLLPFAADQPSQYLQDMVALYCEGRREFHRRHQQGYGRNAPGVEQTFPRLIRVVDHLINQQALVHPQYRSSQALDAAWSARKDTWSNKLDSILYSLGLSDPLQPADAQHPLECETPNISRTNPSLLGMVSGPKVVATTESTSFVGANELHAVESTSKEPTITRISTDRHSAEDSRTPSEIVKNHHSIDSHATSNAEPSQKILAAKPAVLRPKFKPILKIHHKDSSIVPRVVESSARSASSNSGPGKGSLKLIRGGRTMKSHSGAPAERRLDHKKEHVADDWGFSSEQTNADDGEDESNGNSPFEFRRKRLAPSPYDSNPYKKPRFVELDDTSPPVVITECAFDRGKAEGQEPISKKETTILESNPIILASDNDVTQTAIHATHHQSTLSKESGRVPMANGIRKLSVDEMQTYLASMLSGYQTIDAATLVASQADRRLNALESNIHRADRIENQLRVLHQTTSSSQLTQPTPAQANVSATNNVERLQSTGRSHLQHLKRRAVKPFLHGIGDEITKIRSCIRHKIREQDETDDGWRKMEHLGNVLWALDDAIAKARKGNMEL